MNLCADLGFWGAPVCEPRLKVWDYGSLRKASPSRLRRRSRRASERERIAAAKGAAAENTAAENVTAESAAKKKAAKAKATAEKAAAEKAATVRTEKADIEMTTAAVEDAENVTAENAAAEKAVAEKESFVEVKAGNVTAKNFASSSSCGVGHRSASAETCWNCDGEFTLNHLCEYVKSGKESPTPAPLPLCHYCCHLGSGSNPVHYHLQCLCPDKACSCQCYCTEVQLEHKKKFFPSGFSAVKCVDVKDRPRARAIAEARANKLDYKGVPMSQRPCDDENCILDLK